MVSYNEFQAILTDKIQEEYKNKDVSTFGVMDFFLTKTLQFLMELHFDKSEEKKEEFRNFLNVVLKFEEMKKLFEEKNIPIEYLRRVSY